MITIGLDVDGCLADWTAAVIKAIEVDLPIEEVTSFELEDVVAARFGQEKADMIRTVCNDPSFTRNQPVLPWAHELFNAAKALGQVTIITSPWKTEGWYDARVAWLGEHFGLTRKDVLVGARKERCLFDIFVDDKPANIDAYAETNYRYWPEFGGAWMLAWPYNDVKVSALADRLTAAEIIERLKNPF